MGVYDQIKQAIQDLVAPDLHALRAQMQQVDLKIDGVDSRLTTKIDSLRTEMISMKSELIAEIRRLDARMDGMDRELRTAIDIHERLAALEARRPA